MVVWGVCGRGQEVRSVCAFVFGLFTSFLYLISEGVFVIFAYGSLIVAYLVFLFSCRALSCCYPGGWFL